MIKLLLIPAVFIVLTSAFIYFYFFARTFPFQSSKLQIPQGQEVVSQSLPNPPTVSTEASDDIKALAEGLKNLYAQMNAVKIITDKLSNLSEERVKNLEAQATDLKARVSALESRGTTTTAQTTAAKQAPLYIPVGSGQVSFADQNWTSLGIYQVQIDTGQYSGYKSMQLEVNLRLNQPGGAVYARLYNSSDNSAISSEVSSPSTSSALITSATFTLPSGQKTYILQAKSSAGTQAFIETARIKVNF